MKMLGRPRGLAYTESYWEGPPRRETLYRTHRGTYILYGSAVQWREEWSKLSTAEAVAWLAKMGHKEDR